MQSRRWAVRRAAVWALGISALLVGIGWAASRQDPPAIEENDQPPAAEVSWMGRIDAAFGAYLVQPLSRAIFFDFGTSRVLRASGQWSYEDKATSTTYHLVRSAQRGIQIDVIRPGLDNDKSVDRFRFATLDELQAQRPDLHAIWTQHAVDDNRRSIGVPFVVVWLLSAGLFFTLLMKFINIRAFGHAVALVRGKYDDPNNPGEVSHFQALASALSATVGLGNIAGVAIAISIGGPGATFWMIVAGLVGMTTKFAECTLGQMYRKVSPDGVVSGGPMHYLRDGLADIGMAPIGKFLAVLFALLCIGASFGGGNAFQVGQSLNAIRTEDSFAFIDKAPYVYGLVMAFFVGIVIIGGIRSIGAVAGRIVPFMCGAYVLAAIYILAANAIQLPGAIGLIFSSAFSWDAGLGGFVGILVVGIQRAVFSNEAGAGSAAIAHSAARTKEPVSEGIVALMEPFIDTVVVCTMTALVIIVTGVYADPQHADLVVNNKGAALTKEAFMLGGFVWFKWILYGAVVLFAYSTMISWSYYGERCWTSLFGPRASIYYKILFLVFVVLGSIVTAGNILDFSDLLILGMSFPNLVGVLLLSGKVRRALHDYMEKLRAGTLEHH